MCGRKINNYFSGIVGEGSVVEKSLIFFLDPAQFFKIQDRAKQIVSFKLF